jgi:DNA topoisomerase-1
MSKSRRATTLTSKNIRLDNDTLRLNYIAKRGQRIRRQVKDQRLLTTLSAIDDLPGKSLFQYVGCDDEIYALDSGDINRWLKEKSGSDEISAKVFRTWHGSVAALRYVRTTKGPTVKGAAEETAKLLKNTPVISRSSYIHPAIIELARAKKLNREALNNLSTSPYRGLRKDERILLRFLSKRDQT